MGIDLAVRDWVDTHRGPVMKVVALLFNYPGQGGWLTLICLGLGVFLGWRRHSVRPLLPTAAGFVLTYFTVGPMKVLLGRPAPHRFTIPHPEFLFQGGVSFPSGHVVNSFVWYYVLVLLLGNWLSPRWRTVLRLVPPIVVSVATTYAGFHWLTDTVGAVLLAVVLVRLLQRVPWNDLPLGRRLTAAGWAGPGLDP
jgi:membrane-associated phospholipid phosphatase